MSHAPGRLGCFSSNFPPPGPPVARYHGDDGTSRRTIFLASVLFCLGGGSAPGALVGDIDASGAVDVTDAIALLQHLFAGGPPPVELEPSPGLPETGAVTCYGEGAPIACPAPGQPYYGQDGTH